MSRRHTVVWSLELQNDHAARWLAAPPPERRRLTAAADRIKRDLPFAPARRGILVKGRPELRVWRIPEIDPPILAVFEVSSDDRLVRVLQILLLPT